MEKEEGEMSDDNAMLVDDDEIKQEPHEAKDEDCTVLYKANKAGIVVETLEKIDATKLEERAKRFGLNLSGNRAVTQKQIDELYANSGIESGNERHFRFETLHLYGIDGLTTRDIFEYLEDYKPVSLERVDDLSCNVVCQDHIAAALALLVHSREIKSEELKTVLSEKSDHHWREGMPHPKKDLILMRFATHGDKKVRTKKSSIKYAEESVDQSMDPINKNPWGDLCKSWGVYDHQEVFQRKLSKTDYKDEINEPIEPVQIKNKNLALRLGKRHQKSVHRNDSDSDSEWKKKSKTPRMRMHADDEESKQQKKKQLSRISKEEDSDAYAPLSIEVVNSSSSYTPRETTKLSDKFTSQSQKTVESNKERIYSRLGIKVERNVDDSSEGYSSDNSEHNVMSRVQKVGSSARAPGGASVWARLDGGGAGADCTHETNQSDLRQILKSRTKKQQQTDDLRGNVVCQDHIAAALALLVHSREIKSEELKTVLSEKSDHHWREGMPHPKKDLILMRFATHGDKKVRTKKSSIKYAEESVDQSMDPINKNPWGDLCKSWGVYDHQEVFQRKLSKTDYKDEINEPIEPVQIKNKNLALRLGKRHQKSVHRNDSDSDSEWKKKSKTPRMRMHADDEESKQQKKKQLSRISKEEDSDAYAPLSIEVVNSSSSYTPRETTKLSDKFTSQSQKTVESNKERIYSRLGIKVERNVDDSSEGYSSDNSEHNVMSRVQKVGSSARAPGGASVWARLDGGGAGADCTHETNQSDLRQILKSRTKKQQQTDDLRGKLSNSKKAALRIEIDNNYARN